MRIFNKAGSSKSHVGDVPVFGHHKTRSVARARLTSAAIATTQELLPTSGCGGTNGNDAASEDDLYAQQALVADYQYALRYYRSLKHQVGAWQAEFIATNHRQPSIEDATQHGGPDFARLFSSFQEVRARLLVELPGLRAKLQPSQEAEQVAGHDLQHLKSGGRTRAVNANSAVPAATDTAHALPDNSQQVVDSVSTWLRADRYRRQRVVTAAVAAAAAPPQLGAGSSSLQGPIAPSPAEGSCSAEHAAAAAVFGTAPSAGRPLSVGHDGVAAEGCVENLVQQQLKPLEAPDPQRATARGNSRPAFPGVAGDGSGVACDMSHGGREVQEQDWGSHSGDPVRAADGPQQRLLRASAEAAGNVPGVRGTGAPIAAAQTPAAGGTSAVKQQQQQQQTGLQSAPSVRLHGTADRLAEDANIAADSRAKNALLAALQYKRAGGRAPAAPAAPPPGPETRTQEEPGGAPSTDRGQAGAGGVDAADPLGAASGVLGEVQRGDAASAYMGRNRRADTLPETFLVCP